MSASDWTQSLAIEGLDGGCGNHQSFKERSLDRPLHLYHQLLDRRRPGDGSQSTTCGRSDRL
jgi:hypothetical protein